jgi:hypothetical protein
MLQAGYSQEEEDAMEREIIGEKCEFEKAINSTRLLPISFISQRCKEPLSQHLFIGEVATGRWAMIKFKYWLMGHKFTWITGCSGLVQLSETDYEATHTIKRWQFELLLRFDFTIVHWPERMLMECDMLSHYNTWTSKWHKTTNVTTLYAAPTPEDKIYGITTYT